MSEPAKAIAAHSTKLPTVSVVICCYNQAKFIEAAIHSVAAQTYKAFNCVVVDDCSADDSVVQITRILEELNDQRFHFVKRSQRGGQMATMLTGADLRTTPLIAFVDGDDLWQENFLECHVQAHLNPGGVAAISCSDMLLIDETGAILAGGHPPFRRNNPRHRGTPIAKIIGEGEETLVYVAPGYVGWIWSATTAMVFRRSLIDLMRPANSDDIPICADDYWAHAAQALGGTVRLERALACYRIHGSNSWAKNIFIGESTALGSVDAQTQRRIRLALVTQFCAKADLIEGHVPRQQLALILIQLLGAWEARKLCVRNKDAYQLLWQFLPGPPKPRRRNLFSLAHLRRMFESFRWRRRQTDAIQSSRRSLR